MPVYEYECGKCSTRFEVKQSFHDEAKAACKKCGSQARRLFKPVPIMFKGSGFYVTDNSGKKDHLVDTKANSKADYKDITPDTTTKTESSPKAETKVTKTETKTTGEAAS
jgi:putative FmdB family regulatory protein